MVRESCSPGRTSCSSSLVVCRSEPMRSCPKVPMVFSAKRMWLKSPIRCAGMAKLRQGRGLPSHCGCLGLNTLRSGVALCQGPLRRPRGQCQLLQNGAHPTGGPQVCRHPPAASTPRAGEDILRERPAQQPRPIPSRRALLRQLHRRSQGRALLLKYRLRTRLLGEDEAPQKRLRRLQGTCRGTGEATRAGARRTPTGAPLPAPGLAGSLLRHPEEHLRPTQALRAPEPGDHSPPHRRAVVSCGLRFH